MLNALVLAAAEPVTDQSPDPFLVGGVVLLALLALIGALLAFGKGREHS
jgi:hypothetical protein